jgi:hypothetical protein
MNNWLFTSECGLSGHPDKVADLIGDAVLDAFLREDLESRVACQVMLANGIVVVGGQITSHAKIDIPSVVREVLANVWLRRHLGGSVVEQRRGCNRKTRDPHFKLHKWIDGVFYYRHPVTFHRTSLKARSAWVCTYYLRRLRRPTFPNYLCTL